MLSSELQFWVCKVILLYLSEPGFPDQRYECHLGIPRDKSFLVLSDG